ncbi:MAG TPA: ATP-binding cassette domain-containing protein, partial [Nitrobacter sp.]|nr:ATP-binding cassette domain-containing protein [Nitrobacter sp.]
MVDIFNVFRKRPQKRGPQAFARSQADITALGDTIGDMLTSPVRDAPPIARGADRDGPPVTPVPQARRPARPTPEPPRPRAATNGAAAPRMAKRPGYLAVHGVEKSFGSRQVVRGVSIYVRRGEAVGLLGPNGAGKTTVFYMITGLIPADRGAIELDGHDVTKLPMYQRARLGIGYLPQEASIFRGLSVEQNIRAVLEV